MAFRKKQFLGFGVILALMFLLFIVVKVQLNAIKSDLTEIMDDRFKKVDLVTTFAKDIHSMHNDVLGLIKDNGAGMDKRLVSLADSRKEAATVLEQVGDLVSSEQGRATYTVTRLSFESYNRIQDEILESVKAGDWSNAKALSDGAEWDGYSALISQVTTFSDYQKELMIESAESSMRTYYLTLAIIVTTSIVALIFAIAIAVWVIRSTAGSLRKISLVMNRMDVRNQETLPRLAIETKDEIGDISLAFNGMAEMLENYRRMEKETNRSIEEENWVQSRIADMATMYQGLSELGQLADGFIRHVAPMVGAEYGVFYMVIGKKGEQRLMRRGSYAAHAESVGAESIRMGQGLVGQSAQERRIFRLYGVPSDYIRIGSGLGSAPAQNVLIAPVEYEGEVVAVVELASLCSFGKKEERLLKALFGNLGITIDNIKGRMEIVRLLAESQAQTEELQTQAEELQQQAEELQMQSEELRVTNEQLEIRNRYAEHKTKELEQLSEELEAKAEQLEQSSQYKTDFLANMSHELRTPLNSILILSQMLMENQEGSLSEEEQEYSKVINRSGSDLLSLINDILDLSKIEAGKIEIHLEDVHLATLTEAMEINFRHQADQKGLAFRIELEGDLPTVIQSDEQKLHQIIKNLLSNAIKFTENGSVALCIYRPSEDELGSFSEGEDGRNDEREGDWLAIAVADTGIGVPDNKQDLIFQAFQQADSTTSRKYGGTGLGLSISRELAALLGGWIGMESETGKGSRFILYLPEHPVTAGRLENQSSDGEAAAAKESNRGAIGMPINGTGTFANPAGVKEESFNAAANRDEVKTENAPFLGKRVLIADDDVRNVFALTAALEKLGMKVVSANSGCEALTILHGEQSNIDLVLMDIMMPELDGYKTMRAIRKEAVFEGLPIIAITAKAMKNDREKCLEAGASDYISKPINLDQLISLMKVWLSS
ncbi:response regulator [Gorillibacterium massiliense]|uniref:response regulator n=1 Tax=Gorillibacterium massiliense TaxID=1280390 RepID=UPI0004B071C5|nr:response regulator [Gorillibacterium massiliense]